MKDSILDWLWEHTIPIHTVFWTIVALSLGELLAFQAVAVLSALNSPLLYWLVSFISISLELIFAAPGLKYGLSYLIFLVPILGLFTALVIRFSVLESAMTKQTALMSGMLLALIVLVGQLALGHYLENLLARSFPYPGFYSAFLTFVASYFLLMYEQRQGVTPN